MVIEIHILDNFNKNIFFALDKSTVWYRYTYTYTVYTVYALLYTVYAVYAAPGLISVPSSLGH